MEVEPACFVADEEGIEEDILLEDQTVQGSLPDIPTQTAFALHHKLFALSYSTSTFRVVSLVVKAG